MQLAELDELDFASWKHPWSDLDDEAPEIDEGTRRVLTMRRLMETARDYDRPVDLAIETKHPTRYSASWSAGWWSCSTSSAGPARDRRPG